MENIKKLLMIFKGKMEESMNDYAGECEIAFTNIRQQIDKLPQPPQLELDIDQLATDISSQSETAAPASSESDLNVESLKRICIEIDGGENQVDVLTSFLDGVARYSSRTALFILKSGQAVGWRGIGFTRLGGDDNRIKTLAFPLGEGSPFSRIQEEKRTLYFAPSADDIFINQLEGPTPQSVLIVPVVIKDKVAAALYADGIPGDNPLHPHMIEILTFIASNAILLLGQREIVPSPSLTPPEHLTLQQERISKPTAQAAPVAEAPAAEAIPEPVEPPVPEQIKTEYSPEAEEVEAPSAPQPDEAPAEVPVSETLEVPEPSSDEIPPPVDFQEPAAPTPTAMSEMETEPAPPPVSSEATQRLDVNAMQELEELRKKTLGEMKSPTPPVVPTPAETVPEPPPTYEMEAEPSAPPSEPETDESAYEIEVEAPAPPEEPETDQPAYEMEVEPSGVEMEPPSDESSAMKVDEAPPATEWAAPPVEEPAPPPPPPPPAPAPPADPEIDDSKEGEPAVKGSAEVKPPPGFKKDAPGFGFESIDQPEGLSEDDAKKHDEARRFARLLISEIKLYNEPKIKQGRDGNNIYELVKEDVDRSYQLFRDRIPAEIRGHTDYFKQALVSILAEGQESALGEMSL